VVRRLVADVLIAVDDGTRPTCRLGQGYPGGDEAVCDEAEVAQPLPRRDSLPVPRCALTLGGVSHDVGNPVTVGHRPPPPESWGMSSQSTSPGIR
jgi:hypothetical protein